MHLTVIAGLRGAMAYALAYSLPVSYKYRFFCRHLLYCFPFVDSLFFCFFFFREIFLATTAINVLLTVFVYGGLTVPLVKLLKIPTTSEPLEVIDLFL
jgi:NhaP-type Na+/H+ or K+/H+ antiporter